MRHGSRLWRFALPPLAFALLWFLVDVPTALARLAGVEPGWLLAGLALVQLQVVLSALRWRFTAARLGHRIGAGRAVGEYYLATLLNQVLPGGVAGDAARAWRGAGARGGGRADARAGARADARAEAGAEPGAALSDVARGVVVERLAGQLSLLLVALVGFVAWPLLLDAPPPRAGLVAFSSLFALVVALTLALGVSARFGPSRWARAVRGILPTLHRCWVEDGAWLVQGVSSLAVTASYLGVFAIAAVATGAPLPVAAALTVVPLTLGSMLLPVSVGGWGIREAAAAALWPLAGLSAEAGVAASVLYGLLSLVGSLPGLVPLVRPDGSRGTARGGASSPGT